MLRLLTFLLVSAALVLAPAAAPAHAATPARFFGVMGDGPLLSGAVSLDQELARMSSAHVGSMRVAFYWSDAQPYASSGDVPAGHEGRFVDVGGVPTDFSFTDGVVLAAARHGIDVLPTVVRTPAWARKEPAAVGSPPRTTVAYTAYLRALVLRYGPGGALWRQQPSVPARPLRRWQVWNEPDIEKYWSPARSQSGWAKPYVSLLRASSKALHAADPGAQVVAAGLTNRSWVDLGKVYAAGGRRWFDVAAIHPFSRRVANVLKIVELARATMRRAGDARKPLALTEVSWSSGKGRSTFNYGWETTEAGQADRVRQILPALARHRASWRLAGVWWYTWLSRAPGSAESFDYSGLRRLTAAGTPVDKPALKAWRDTVRRLVR